MLDWVRGLAESVSEEGACAAGLADEYFPMPLVVPEAVARKSTRRASIRNGTHLQAIPLPLNPELVVIIFSHCICRRKN